MKIFLNQAKKFKIDKSLPIYEQSKLLVEYIDNKTKDKERDTSGYIEKQMKKADDAFFKMTKNKHFRSTFSKVLVF